MEQIQIIITADVQPMDIGMLTSVKESIISRYDGTALHITDVTVNVPRKGHQVGNNNIQVNYF